MRRVESFKFLVEFFNIKSLFAFLLPLFTLVMLSSCDVHQWPEPNNEPAPDPPVVPDNPNEPDNPEDPDEGKTATVGLKLQYFTDFTYRDHLYDPKTGKVTPVSAEDGDTYDNLDNIAPGTPMKVTVKVHRDNSNKTLVSSQTFVKELDTNYDCDVDVEVPVGVDCLITVWGHLLDENEDAFYDDSDFNSISLIKNNYRGNTDMRDAYRGHLKVNAPEEGQLNDVIYMRRPMCKMEFVTTGLKEFFDNEEQRQGISSRGVSAQDYTVVISYPVFYPTSYMAMDDHLEFSSSGYSFATELSLIEDNPEEASMGFDYVLINDSSDSGVQVQVTVFHSDGTQVGSTGMITVPMQRDRHVVVRGNFLTTNGNGGVGIDPDFEGDFNIPVY